MTREANSATELSLCLLLALEAKKAFRAASAFLSQREGKGIAFRSKRRVDPNLLAFSKGAQTLRTAEDDAASRVHL